MAGAGLGAAGLLELPARGGRGGGRGGNGGRGFSWEPWGVQGSLPLKGPRRPDGVQPAPDLTLAHACTRAHTTHTHAHACTRAHTHTHTHTPTPTPTPTPARPGRGGNTPTPLLAPSCSGWRVAGRQQVSRGTPGPTPHHRPVWTEGERIPLSIHGCMSACARGGPGSCVCVASPRRCDRCLKWPHVQRMHRISQA